ncbi:hypothetical protein, partial [Saccharomonospora saliphila]|uniref:hypothetical protein n=1 Tax=Saccharomonospora saliphila TaxID=369829 RepID=UPI000362D215
MTLPAFVAVPVTSGGLLLAQEQQPDGGGQGADFGKSSPVGLLLLLVFFVAVGFLIRSMTKHLKRIPASFDGDDGDDGDDGAGAMTRTEAEPGSSTVPGKSGPDPDPDPPGASEDGAGAPAR